MSTIRETYGLDAVVAHKITGMSSITTPYVCKSQELIGIEVEVENIRDLTTNPNKVWVIDEDGSLRNNGREFITKPIPASSAPVALEYLMNNYLNKKCCFSPRTSVHIHLNMQDFTQDQVKDYILLYSIFEKLFYKFTGRGRMKNIYCVPLIDTDLLVRLGERRILDGWSKYTGLNVLPLQNYGTIEFRHMHGTSDVGKLTMWINLITSLKEYVRATPTASIRSDISNMDDDYAYEELLKNIFGEAAAGLKYEGLVDVSYLPAKQALASSKSLVNVRNAAQPKSDFYSFKEN